MSKTVTTPSPSTPKSNNYPWAWLILIILVVSLLIFSGEKSIKNESSEQKDPSKTEKEALPADQNDPVIPPTRYINLKEGIETRIEVPTYLTVSIKSGGKKYYFRKQNGEWEIHGDGIKRHYEKYSYCDVKFFEEEITLTVQFFKK